MKDYGRFSLFVLLLGTILVSPLLAGSHRLEVLKAVSIDGVKLNPGQYELVLNDNTAEIYRGRTLLVSAEVTVLPLGDGIPNTIRQTRDGALMELRLKEERVLFNRPKTGQ